MKDLLNEVKASVMGEYDRAAAKYGKANNSPHESYAVILEEYEEAEEQANNFKNELERYWRLIKNNANTDPNLRLMWACAQLAAAEWIQVAAMCYKAMQEKEGV